jgi:hypothetical protein
MVRIFFCNVMTILPSKANTDDLLVTVLKPGPARWVDPGPGQPRPRTGPGGGKNPIGSRPCETRLTRDPVHPVYFFILTDIK